MSWNKYFIIVINVNEKDLKNLVDKTGYGKMMTQIEKVNFRIASNKNYSGIGFGLVDNNFWIISPTQAEKFFNEEKSILEINLSKKFPDKKIIAVAENGTVDAFGFSIIENGKRKRVCSGCDGEYEYKFGEPITIEKRILEIVKNEIDTDEKAEIIENEGVEGFESYIKFESMWRVPFELFNQQIGKTIDEIYEDNPEFEIYLQK